MKKKKLDSNVLTDTEQDNKMKIENNKIKKTSVKSAIVSNS